MPSEAMQSAFHPAVRAWFEGAHETPTPVQERGWPVLRSGASGLLVAPTGSGKTLAAFLVALDRLFSEPVPEKERRCRVLYVSPLKALAVDVEKNLRAPLAGIQRAAERLGEELHVPTISIRTGDTPSRERGAFRRRPTDILITTPESLYLMLTSRVRGVLGSVECLVLDEVHALVGNKRGAHLALSLERLEELLGPDRTLQRIGLSATVRPLEATARFLGGHDDSGRPRPVTVVDAGRTKELDLTVAVPVEDMARLGEPVETHDGPASGEPARRSIWPAVHPMLLELIRAHRSTLIFVNSRRLAERLATALNELAAAPEGDGSRDAEPAEPAPEIAMAHHGSVAREKRLEIEDALKAGRLPALVATSTLELGIDMGAIDLVVQVESPPSVASAVQRIGRAGHHVGVPSKGILVPKYRGDLLSTAALAPRAREGAVEEVHPLRNPLDVLAQQVVAMAAMDDWEVERLGALVRRAAPFAELPPAAFEGVLDMLATLTPLGAGGEVRPRITWDRIAGVIRGRRGAQRIAVTNPGTIPDRGLYGVFLAGGGGGRIGELDEEMVFEMKEGDVFLLGATSWRVDEITHDRVLVAPAPGVPARMPFWRGERAGRTLELGRAIGALTRTLREGSDEEGVALLRADHDLDERAARNLVAYVRDQEEAAGAVPDDRTLVLERSVDEMGDWRLCLLSPFGGRVHAPWALAIGALLRRALPDPEHGIGLDPDLLWTDDGIVVRIPETEEPPDLEALLPEPEEVADLVTRELGASRAHASGQHPLFAARFREAAARALLLPRRHPGRRAPLWHQRRRSAELLAAVADRPAFPVVLEAYRECLQDHFDLPALEEILREIRARKVRVVTVDTRSPSPFASTVLFSYVANFLYEGDAPLAERRAQALAVDPARLRELLGHSDLRELLATEDIDTVERRLQRLDPERRARHVDALHDLLSSLGDLGREALAARSEPPEAAAGWIDELLEARRAVEIPVAGERRLIAAEEAGLYRDALGAPSPAGLPGAFLEPVEAPLRKLVERHARTHGPFRAAEVARRYGLAPEAVLHVLRDLERDGHLLEGTFRPGATGPEWCSSEVLRRIRNLSLARLRREVAPVSPDAYGRLALSWQLGADDLLDAVTRLEGADVPASDVEALVLPARVEGYDPAELDELLASGAVLWVGRGPLGPRDGRVSLYLAEHAGLLVPREGGADGPPEDELHEAIRTHLREHGASFFPQIHEGAGGGFFRETVEALWDLVWAGEVTNDTLRPLRSRIRPPRRRRGVRRGEQPPEVSGRWSLVASRLGAAPEPAAALAVRARAVLERRGLVAREAIRSEGLPGGWTALYPALRTMEEAGRVRRGYFVEGLGAAQFALPGAVDRLRELSEPPEEPETVVLAATDPANPYGEVLRWPEHPRGQASRTAGTRVVLLDGALAAWMGRGGGRLLTFPEGVEGRIPSRVREAIATALAALVCADGLPALLIEEIDGEPAARSPLRAALEAAGFRLTTRGLWRRRARG